jgi:hypothetical protein
VANRGGVGALRMALGKILGPRVSLDGLTNQAYWLVHPQGPRHPSFYEAEQLPFVESWVRIRDWVDYFLYRPAGVHSPSMPLQTLGVPFAQGDPNPAWPVISTDPRGCQVNYLDAAGGSHGMLFQRFGAPRGSKDPASSPTRNHIGHDCIANEGDVVVAPESGGIEAIRSFYSGTDAVYLVTDSKITLVLGEIESGSPEQFGVAAGQRVTKGQPVARVGSFNVGAQLPFHMLHFETWDGRRSSSGNWYDGSPQPTDLLNPTAYLLRSRCRREGGGPTAVTAAGLHQLGRAVMAVPSPAFPH